MIITAYCNLIYLIPPHMLTPGLPTPDHRLKAVIAQAPVWRAGHAAMHAIVGYSFQFGQDVTLENGISHNVLRFVSSHTFVTVEAFISTSILWYTFSCFACGAC